MAMLLERTAFQRLGRMFVVAAVIGLGLAAGSGSAVADDAVEVNDLAVPMEDAAAIELGKTRFGQKCSGFCHGSGGKGGRGPCLICGKFKRGGKNSDLYRNIAEGVKGTAMGAFGEALPMEEIVAVIAYLRTEQKKKEAAEQ